MGKSYFRFGRRAGFAGFFDAFRAEDFAPCDDRRVGRDRFAATALRRGGEAARGRADTVVSRLR